MHRVAWEVLGAHGVRGFIDGPPDRRMLVPCGKYDVLPVSGKAWRNRHDLLVMSGILEKRCQLRKNEHGVHDRVEATTGDWCRAQGQNPQNGAEEVGGITNLWRRWLRTNRTLTGNVNEPLAVGWKGCHWGHRTGQNGSPAGATSRFG